MATHFDRLFFAIVPDEQAALTSLRPWIKSWRFKPHLTLIYDDCEANRNIDSIEWTVREFVLVHSLVGKTQYRLLKRFPLQATQS